MVDLGHALEASLGLDPLEDLAADVDAPAVGRVVERSGVRLGLEAQHCGDARQVIGDEVAAHDDDLNACGPHVLLDAGVDQSEARHVDGFREEHRGLVGDEDVALGVGELRVARAIDGVVLADVDEARVVANGEVGNVGDVGELLIFRRCEDLGVAEDLGFFVGLICPVAGDDVVGLFVRREVQEHRGEDERVAALEEQHGIVVRDVHERAEVGLGVVDDLLEDGGTVAHLVYRHAATAVVEHL